MRKRHLASVCLTLCIVVTARAEDWPAWLGAHHDGSTTEVVAAWTKPLDIKWRVKVAEGHASPVVADGKVILHTASNGSLGEKEEQRVNREYVTAYDAKNGQVVWVGRMDKKKFKSEFGSGPRATPAIADGRVYCFGVTGTFAMFELASGKLVADQVELLTEYQGGVPKFGVSAAPFVDGGKVYLQVGGPEAGVVALDAKTGKLANKYLKEPASYAAISAAGTGDDRQIVVLNADGVFGLPPAGGEQFWRYRFKDILSESSTTPICVGDRLIVSSITRGTVALKMGKTNGKPSVSEAWKNAELSCYFSTPVAVGNELYLVTGRLKPPIQADLHCVDLETGKTLWTRPKVGHFGATLIRTGDKKLLLLEEGGELVLIEPDAKEFRELARSKVCNSTWAHPAIADGCLFVRDKDELICVQLTSQAE